MLKRVFLMVAAIGLIASCSDDKESQIGKPGAGGSLADIEAGTGGWKTGCVQSSGTWDISLMEVVGSSMTVLIESFSNDACSALEERTRFQASAVTEGTNATDSTSTNLNLAIQQVEYWLDTDALVNLYNTNEACGINNWQKQQWTDVSSTSCRTENDVYYTIFKIVNDSLFMGLDTTTNDGSTPSKRPTSLDLTNPYTKL